jgi:hypothetical protein
VQRVAVRGERLVVERAGEVERVEQKRASCRASAPSPVENAFC